jgi:hypothetical protein
MFISKKLGVQGSTLIFGGGGNNNYGGTSDKDWIYGNGGDDHVEGNGGDDFIYGGADQDVLFGEAGNNLLDGGEGSDIADYSNSPHVPLHLSLLTPDENGRPRFRLVHGQGTDTLVSIETIDLGSSSDKLVFDDPDDSFVAGPFRHVTINFGRAPVALDTDVVDLSNFGHDRRAPILPWLPAIPETGVYVNLSDANNQTVDHHTVWDIRLGDIPFSGVLTRYHLANANTVIGTLHGPSRWEWRRGRRG